MISSMSICNGVNIRARVRANYAAARLGRSGGSLMLTRVTFLIVLLMMCPSFTFAQSPEILSRAKKEGEVILYTTMSVRDFEFFNKAAKEKYPFLNIRHVYLSSGRQAARVMQ